jgi:predicted NUDIX family phosphoesterase
VRGRKLNEKVNKNQKDHRKIGILGFHKICDTERGVGDHFTIIKNKNATVDAALQSKDTVRNHRAHQMEARKLQLDRWKEEYVLCEE